MCVDPLYSPVSLLFVSRDPVKGVSKLARLLSAMDKTMNKLVVEYYHKPIEERERDNRGPYTGQIIIIIIIIIDLINTPP
ncbi:MAG: hypothetical protein MJE68_10770 [Proteobacteria bacterium]|nr:hypothetical protein [Pseudomonadota bacterium]